MISNNLSDYLVRSKYSKVLQTALYQHSMLFFEFQKGGKADPQTPPGCATGLGERFFFKLARKHGLLATIFTSNR